MSTYEWVIEHENCGGVTTSIVFDFADGGTGGHVNENLVDMASSSRHTAQRRDDRGRAVTGSASTAGGLLSVKDGTRSEGGSSRRSSKRSNGSRSRKHLQHTLGTTGRSSGFSGGAKGSGGGLGVMAMPTSSAYASVSLRQRYQRVLGGGGRCGGTAASISPISISPTTMFDAAAPTSSSGPVYPLRADPNAALRGNGRSLGCDPLVGVPSGRHPPDTLLFSTGETETVGEENSPRHCTGPVPRHRSRRAAGGNSSGGGVSSVPWASPVGEGTPTTLAHVTANNFTTTNAARRRALHEAPAITAARVTPPSRPCRFKEVRDNDENVSDDNDLTEEEGPHYVLRDVWAMRSAYPRTVPTHATEHTAFVPLHPINVEEETTAKMITVDRFVEPTGGTAFCSVLSSISGINTNHKVPYVPAKDQEEVNKQHLVDAAEEYRRYNKMLLKKERQRRRGCEWRRSEESSVCPSRSPAKPPFNANTHAGRGRTLGDRNGLDGRDHARGSSTDSSYDDVCQDCSDTSSLECLSNSSRDDYNVCELRADPAFAATVQSLANRAERERKRMESREEQMLWCEAAQNTKRLPAQRSPQKQLKTPSTPLPTTDPAFATTTVQQSMIATGAPRHGEDLIAEGVTKSKAPSSFFISPIHQSVAAESAQWTCGTRFQFLGQGGLGGSIRPMSASSLSSGTVKPPPQRCISMPPLAATSRRRRRSRDDDDNDEEIINASHNSGALSSVAQLIPDESTMDTRRVLKKRKRGSCARQAIVGECGGSRALRPVAAPSFRPPVELLPCSKKDMCERLLEKFLMEAVLDDTDDFQLH